MYDYLLLVGRIAHSLAVDGHLSRFDGSECEVLLSAIRYFSIANEDIKANNKTIAETAGVSDATASRSLESLAIKGYLVGIPGLWKLGPVLVAILQSHERAVGLKQHVVSSSKARENNSHVSLSEAQIGAGSRKGTSMETIRGLVDKHGSETVDAAIASMTAQYPTDENVRSFAALLTRACEHAWTHRKVVQAQERAIETQAITKAAPDPTVKAALTSTGVELPVVGIKADGSVEVETLIRGRTQRAVILPHQFPQFKWLR